MIIVVVCCYALLSTFAAGLGDMTHSDKQTILNFQNFFRAAVKAQNMKRMEWSKDLEEVARELVDSCKLKLESPKVGVNVFHTLEFDGNFMNFANQILEKWILDEDNGLQQKILWADTDSVGCAMDQCPKVAELNDDANKLMNVTLVVCVYTPRYFDDESGQLYQTGKCDPEKCPSEYKKCAQFTGTPVPPGKTAESDHLYCCRPGDITNPTVPQEKVEPTVIRRITSISPKDGSLGGQTQLSIFGTGFNRDQFKLGNVVILSTGTGTVECVIISLFISDQQLVCNTKEATDLTKDTSFSVNVNVISKEYLHACHDCIFTYKTSETPIVRIISELASSSKEILLNISGDLFAEKFGDPDDIESSSGNDVDNKGSVFTRIFLGGNNCTHLKPDKTSYPHHIDDDGKRAYITCKFNFKDLIASLNLTLIVGGKGSSLPSPYIKGVDNNLKPYNFQLHADILQVTPKDLSIGGGTKITITMSHHLTAEDELEVKVGGAPCEKVTLLENQDDQNSTIECTTPPSPPNTTYYPGGRGTRREVFNVTTYLDTIQAKPRSDEHEVHERLFISSFEEAVSLARFSHRYSGFFVPPKTSLYTFNVRSDDRSRFYLSPNMSNHYLPKIIDAPHWTRQRWDAYPFQMSSPVYLKQGRSYYFELLGNEYGRNWELGLGVKLHDSKILRGPNSADREQQEIAITSSIAREEHMIVLKAYPKVQRISIQPVITEWSVSSANIMCTNMTLAITWGNHPQVNVTISLSDTDKEIGNVLNEAIYDFQFSVFKKGYSGLESFWSSESNSFVNLTLDITSYGYDVATDIFADVNVISDPTCNDGSAELRLNVTVKTIQDFYYPNTFNVGFGSRFTSQLPLNVTAESLQVELTGLLSRGCMNGSNSDQSIVTLKTFESPQQSTREENITSFCGLYSMRDPGTISNDEYKLSDRPYICFAYKGDLPLLRIQVTYKKKTVTNGVSETKHYTTRKTISSTCDPDWPFNINDNKNIDGWHYYGCVHIEKCVKNLFPNKDDDNSKITYSDFTVSKVYFHYGPSFYVDNLAFTKSKVELNQDDSLRPVTPNKVNINYFEVIKVNTPIQVPVTYSNVTDGGTGQEFIMEVARFRVIYGVRDCGFEMGLLNGSYDGDNSLEVHISRERAASKPVSGNYSLTIGGTSQLMRANATASEVQQLMNITFSNEGAFNVIRSRTCAGYSWTVSWLDARGDLPLMGVDGDNLIGDETNINVIAVVDGGLWVRPIRGDMLRLPEIQPQVEVIVNKIPSSCLGHNCNLSYEAESTPEILSITPTEGKVGTDVFISGSKFSNTSADVIVTVGKSECEIISINDSLIKCTVGRHSAGCYAVGVYIGGVGNATSEPSACFKYLLMVDSVSPSVGGVSGGHILTLSGEGFSEFVNDRDVKVPFSHLPWFRYGVGLPKEEQMKHYCPSFSDKLNAFYNKVISFSKSSFPLGDDFCIVALENHIREIYSNSSMQVLVGGSPCIIVSSTISNLTCVPMTGTEGLTDITVSVFDQTVTLNSNYSISLNSTVKVTDISPTSGSVLGNNTILAMGISFVSEANKHQVQVTVGGRRCTIEEVSNVEIHFRTASHSVGTVLVFISVPSGIGILQSASYTTDNAMASSLFPTFYYELEITNTSVLVGSLLGCTTVTLVGVGFIHGETTVQIGGEQAKIDSVSPSEVTFQTPKSSRRVHSASILITVDTVDGHVTTPYTLNQTTFTIAVGDSIKWSWNLSIKVPHLLEVEIFKFEPGVAKNIIFSKSAFGSSNSIETIFNKVGMHYIGVTIVKFTNIIASINVTELVSFSSPMKVFVGSFEARHELTSSNEQNETGGCGVNDTLPTPTETNTLSFYYSVDATPIVTSVIPKKAGIAEEFTITGVHFSNLQDSNEVMIGDFSCNVTSSTTETIKCAIPSSMQPPVHTSLLVSVINRDLGSGCARVSNLTDATVVLLPSVSDVSPSEGSLAGGTDIVISGYGFSCNGVLSITIDEVQCVTKSIGYTYSTIECTSQHHEAGDSDLKLYCGSEELEYICKLNATGYCTFSYSEESTATVEEIVPDTINSSGNHTIELIGQRFPNNTDECHVTLNGIPCPTISANSTHVRCVVPSQPAGTYMLKFIICKSTANSSKCIGNVRFESGVGNVTFTSKVIKVSPQIGSLNGGTEITLIGYGFPEEVSSLSVTIGQSIIKVISTTTDHIVCITSKHDPGKYLIEVRVGEMNIHSDVQFEFNSTATPTVTSIDPSTGIGGQVVNITGTGFDNSVKVEIGEKPCKVLNVSSTSLICQLALNYAKTYPVKLRSSFGNADSNNVNFTYMFFVTSISPTLGSMAGMSILEIEGGGFNPTDTEVTVCNRTCSPTSAIPSIKIIKCFLPSFSDVYAAQPDETEVKCSVNVMYLEMTATYNGSYFYKRSLTPQVDSINVSRGGTEGGTVMLIKGHGFSGNVNVTIQNIKCDVDVELNNDTDIICTTKRSGVSLQDTVMVKVEGKGFAISKVTYSFIDVWSSNFTWGGGPLPSEGDFVVITKGQTLLLDTKTPILAYILIQGGKLIFDDEKEDNEVQLHTKGGIITNGGSLVVGTEEKPFLKKTQIVLYGNILSTEIPVYGAKTLAVRKGEIHMHGKPINVTWTRLSETASKGARNIHLQDTVSWEVGGKVVLASTSYSQEENEELEIEEIKEGNEGSILTLTTPLKYEHISEEQTIAGRKLETRGEVGYLTRNIVVRGNRNSEWDKEVAECPDNFRPGQFEVQTCFNGRFGKEVIGDEFGAQIMIHAAELNKGDVLGQFEYVEVTHAGQAFKLGRYPIHFHLNGNVSGSYVRGCSIHHSFNRAITMHGVNELLVEKNVAYNIMGHAYFLEDGNEQFNIIQDNLGIFVRSSSSLLNVDITAATFWIVNANNYVRRNAAAGGTHFGFWYRLTEHPTGPSFDESFCPRKQQVLEFEDNTAHSFGWYGLWIFRQYHPSPSGECTDKRHGTSQFNRFFAWRNDKGVEFTEIGSIQLRDSVLLDNKLAGIEVTEVESEWNDVNGSLITNCLIVGYTPSNKNHTCTESGIKTPKSFYLTVSGVTFANFDRDNCWPITACSFCKHNQGGFETRYKNISFIKKGDKLTTWKWEHEHIHRDLDGTLTETGNPALLIPTNSLLNASLCQNHAGSENGSICDGGMEFGRLALFNPSPLSLTFASLTVNNTHGEVVLPFVFKRLRGTGPAYMAQLELNQIYTLAWPNADTFTNISYTTLISGFSPTNYVILRYKYPQPLDIIEIAGVKEAKNASNLSNPETAVTGDYFVSDDNLTLDYIIKGGIFPLNEKKNFFKTEKCRYKDCIPPPPPTLPPPIPPGRSENATMWSNTSTWPNNSVPTTGQNVTIERKDYIVADINPPKLNILIIKGVLEIDDGGDKILHAYTIIIDGGRLVAGYPDTPFKNKFTITLHGNKASPLYLYGEHNIRVDAKGIGVFGELILYAETTSSSHSWTLLGNMAHKGDSEITLKETMDWAEGDEIFITSTGFDAYETEVFKITKLKGKVVTLNSTLKFTHLAVDESVRSVSYSIRAEVGRLSRKIVIENAEPETADAEQFGCRVLVGVSENSLGSVKLQGVEFKGCGQIGLSESYDPRFALALVNLGGSTDSYVLNCSFHDGYNTAIGMFGTNNVSLINNVIHGTVGPSVLVTGSSHTVVNNLASLSRFIGTYRGRNERSNSLWTANFMIVDTSEITFTGNHAAGGAKAGIHTDGEDCTNSASIISHNVAHSSLHCYHIGYRDGSATGCSRFANATAYACHHYGFFMYSKAGLQLLDSTFINNKAAVFVSVAGPPAISHVAGNKIVEIERVNVISASATFDCSQDAIVPEIANHHLSHSPGLRTPTGGHVGIFIPSFLSNTGAFPKFIWPSNHNYPAIAGFTTMKHVTFVNFANRCEERRDAAIMTNNQSEDANHPVHLEMISFENDDRFNSSDIKQSKLLVHKPNIKRVNPSDCVDMDCDGFKQVLLTDFDGSFTGTESFRTLVSKAEFEWDGDLRRGLGDYRIPKAMLSKADGSPKNASVVYPQKGIVRADAVNGDSQCQFNDDWNMYVCAGLEHLMLVLESLDEDTEARRLSPIGMGSNGYINLLNGPMDHGWCGGYTCQERISTFYAIVGSNFSYAIGLTSTNPQNFTLRLLNSNDDQGIVISIVYLAPQRLDVFVENKEGKFEYVVPTNAERQEDSSLKYNDDKSIAEYYPLLASPNGANYYNRNLKQLHVNIKGSRPYRIIIAKVILLSLTVSVTTENFFDEEFIVRNLALLLGIPKNKIRTVDVKREEQPAKRRRRQTDSGSTVVETITIEIGDVPNSVISTETSTNDTNSTTASPTSTLSFEKLKELTELVAAVVQTGEILNGTNATVISAEIEKPVAAPEDPSGGVLATPETGGPQPNEVDENTPTFYDQQLMTESEQAGKSSAVQLSIPATLVLTQGLIGTVVEGLPISQEVAPVFTMLDNKGTVSENLGVDMPWTLTAAIISGPKDGFLANHTVPFVKGHATFQGAVFSHPGTYYLTLAVSFPTSADYSIIIGPIAVTGRSLSLEITQQPQDGNITSELYPNPVVKLIDETESHSDLLEHTWRNTTWYVAASLEKGKQQWTTELKNGKAIFTDITITDAGKYKIVFSAFTVPSSVDLLPENVKSAGFEIIQPSISQFTITYGNINFNVVVNGNSRAFIEVFETKLIKQYPGIEIYNTTISEGSIIVSTFITSRSTDRLVEVIQLLLTEGNVTLALEFGGQTLVPSSIMQGYTYLVYPEDNLVLILAICIPAAVLLCLCILVLVVCLCWRRREAKKKLNLQVGHASNTLYDVCYPQDTEGVENGADIFLRNQNSAADDVSLGGSQRKTVVTSIDAISVPGSFFTNPSVLNREEHENIYM